jgi:hypothetical protein
VKLKAVQILSKAIIKMSIRKERQSRSSELKMTDFFLLLGGFHEDRKKT